MEVACLASLAFRRAKVGAIAKFAPALLDINLGQPEAQPSKLQQAPVKPPTSRIRCLWKGCNKEFGTVSARNKHSKRKHKQTSVPGANLKLSKEERLERVERREWMESKRFDRWMKHGQGKGTDTRPMTADEVTKRKGRPWGVLRKRRKNPIPVETSSEEGAAEETGAKKEEEPLEEDERKDE